MTSGSAQQPVTELLRIRPAPGSQTDAAASYFVIKSRPGATVRQELQIASEYKRPVQLRIARVDAVTASKGGILYEVGSAPVDDEGTWIQLGRDQVDLSPGQTARIPFRVDIPKETEPGVHVAGIAIELVETSKPDDAPTQGGAVVDFKNRFVVAVQVDLPGNSKPELIITGVEPAIQTSGVDLEVLIENVGFGFAKGEGVLELPDEGFEEPLTLGTVVPGTAIRYPVTWLPDPAEGEYAVEVTLTYSEGDPELLTGRASWEGTFLIGQGQVEELEQLQGGEGFNWLLVIVPALLLLLLIALLVWRRRRSKPAAPAPKPAPQPTPAPAPQAGYTGGYTGSAGGTFGSASRPPQQTAPPAQQRPAGSPPPPPPPPPKQGP